MKPLLYLLAGILATLAVYIVWTTPAPSPVHRSTQPALPEFVEVNGRMERVTPIAGGESVLTIFPATTRAAVEMETR